MIIFHQRHVEQTESVIFAAAGNDRCFFQRAQARRCFTRIQNLHATSSSRLDKFPRQRRDPAEPLQKIQCHSFGLENGSGSAANLDDRLARPDASAICTHDLRP